MKSTRSFAPLEPCAINPQAFGGLFFEAPSAWSVDDGIATLTINGPLGHHSSFWEQSYEDLVAHASAIMAERPRLVVLSIDSPGGVVSGCFDTVRRLRAIFGSTRVVAFVTGAAASAAYALACVADEIVVSETSLVGSIGVIDAIVDATAANAQAGLRFHLFTSGKRKADGVSHLELPPEGAIARQLIVDSIAGRFFELVGERRGIDPEVVRSLEAAVFVGADAVAAGLADRVEHLVDFLARVTAGKGASSTRAPASQPFAAPAARVHAPELTPAARAATHPPKVPTMSAPARSLPPPTRKPAPPSAAELAKLEAKLAKLEAKQGVAPPRSMSKSSTRTAPPATSAKASPAPVDAKRLEAKRELDRRMGVGFSRGVITTPTMQRFGIFHESELAEGAQLAAPPRERPQAKSTPTKPRSSAPKASNVPMDAKRLEAKRELDRRMGCVRFVHAARHVGNRLEFGLFHESELGAHHVRMSDLAGKTGAQQAEVIEAGEPPRPASIPRLSTGERRRLDEAFGLNIHQGIVVDGVSLKFGVIAHASEFAAPGREVITQRRIA